MAEIEPDVAPASGFKVRPLSRVASVDSSVAGPQQAVGSSPEPQDPKSQNKHSRLRELTEELRAVEARVRLGGGPDKIAKQHKAHKLTARERIDLLFDEDTYKQEIGLLVAYDQYRAEDSRQKAREQEIGMAPAAGVVTT